MQVPTTIEFIDSVTVQVRKGACVSARVVRLAAVRLAAWAFSFPCHPGPWATSSPSTSGSPATARFWALEEHASSRVCLRREASRTRRQTRQPGQQPQGSSPGQQPSQPACGLLVLVLVLVLVLMILIITSIIVIIISVTIRNPRDKPWQPLGDAGSDSNIWTFCAGSNLPPHWRSRPA